MPTNESTQACDTINPTLTAVKLPDHIKDVLVMLADDGDSQWKQAAAVLEQMFEDAKAENIRLPKMRMYSDAAAYLGQKSSTVRNWAAVYKKVGDSLLNEYADTFRYSHWRAIIPAAKKAGKTLDDFAAELAKTADNYGGMPIPVDVIIARGGEPEKTGAELFVDAAESAQAELDVMSKHVDAFAPKLKPQVLDIARQVTDLAGRVEMIIDERTKLVRSEGDDDASF